MADVDSKPSTAPTTSSSTFNLSAYRESAAFLLTFLAPPAAIAVRQGKVDLESRHLALSLALYLSVICYLPAVVHAYWLLYVRDNGGVEEWTGARVRQARALWNEHGGIVKAKVDEYSPMVIEKYEIVRSYANYATAKKDEAWSFVAGVISAVRELYREAREAYAAGTAIDWAKKKMHVVVEKVIEKYEGVRNYATVKKDEAWSFVTGVISAVRELFEEAREAYAAGTAIDWAKEKMHVAVEKVKTLLESYPRLQAIVRYVEERVPLVLEFLGKIYETIRAKVL